MNKFISCYSTLLFGLMLLITSCHNSGSGNAPDVSNINISYNSYNFYKDFAALDTNHVAAGLEKLNAKYPDFLNFYLERIIGFGYQGRYNDTNQMMHSYLTYKDYKNLLDTVKIAFPDTKKYDDWIKKSFQYIRYYDSSIALPQNVYYFVSFLRGPSVEIQSDKNMGVSLDMFLGRNFTPYAQIGIPDYATIRMTDDNIPVGVCKDLYEDKYRPTTDNKDLLALMIQQGKEIYFLQKVTPYLNDETRFGFTKDQMDWCKKNESMIYNFFIQNNLLFDKDQQKILRYVNDGPSSAGMPDASPGNTGSYIGWRIVCKYMDKHSISLHKLLEMNNAQEILQGANYKP